MTETAFDRFWQLVWGAIALKPAAYQHISTLPYGVLAGLVVVAIAGLSQAIAQGTVLFVNRVRPFRFVISLLIAALLFIVGFGFWAASTWVTSRLLFRHSISSVPLVISILGLSYAPQILSFFVALPYLGVPIGIVLSVWSFLTLVLGLKTMLAIDTWEAFWCGVLGWAVFEILQRTIGRPFAAVGQWITNSAAGVTLVTNLRDVERMLETGLRRSIGR